MANNVFANSSNTIIDGSSSANQNLVGTADSEIFFFGGSNSGKDKIANFGVNDVLVTRRELVDNNGDGFITFGRNGVLDLDGPDANLDHVTMGGVAGNRGVRILGNDGDGNFVYADATVRPTGAIEGTIDDNVLTGDAAGTRAQTFFYDTRLGLDLGDDRINNFGANDRIVTTTRIFDSNNDGIIEFAANDILDLPGKTGGVSSDPSGGTGPDAPGGSILLFGVGGGQVTALQFDGTSTGPEGTVYYTYSLIDLIDL